MESPAGDERSPRMTVEVAYALPDNQTLLTLDVPAGTTARQAIELSGLLRRHPEIDIAVNRVGIFGQLADLEQVLRPRDRVEVYRSLIADPKEIRRQRARKT